MGVVPVGRQRRDALRQRSSWLVSGAGPELPQGKGDSRDTGDGSLG